jgi:hypothetical protein
MPELPRARNNATFGASVMTERTGYARSHPSVPRAAKKVMAEFDTAKSSSPVARRRMFSCDPLVDSAVTFHDWPVCALSTSASAPPTTKNAPPGGAVPTLMKARSVLAPLPPEQATTDAANTITGQGRHTITHEPPAEVL